MENIDILNMVIFYGFGGCIILFAILCILANRILYSLLASVVVFLAAAGIYFLIGAEYNAVVQIAIYGVAIPILFVLAIMFTADSKDKKTYLAFTPRFYLTFFALGILFITVIYLFATVFSLNQNNSWILNEQTFVINKYQMFSAITNGFLVNHVFAFELFSLLLLIVVVGLSTLNLVKEKNND